MNYGFVDAKEINAQLIRDFDDKKIELHERIISQRDKEFAHSDASSNKIQIYSKGWFSHSRGTVRQLLEKNELDTLKIMVNKIIDNIDKRFEYLK